MTSVASSATLTPIEVQAQAAAKTAARPHRGIIGTLFHEILDIINPLQHIPIISTIYRHLTGDAISPVAKVAGGALYGGLIGLGLSVADVAVQEATGEDTGEHILGLIQGKPEKAAPATALAAATAAPMATTAATPVDDRVWFPAHPAGSARPKALYYKHTAPTLAAAAATPAAAPETAAATPITAPASQTAALASATPPAAPGIPAPPIPASQLPASLARAAVTPTPSAPGGVPQMDQATFDALLRSFGGQAVAGITPAPAGRPQPGAPTSPAPANTAPTNLRSVATPATTLPVAKSYDAALQAMQSALDRYQAQGGRIPSQMPTGAPRGLRAVPAT